MYSYNSSDNALKTSGTMREIEENETLNKYMKLLKESSVAKTLKQLLIY
jgi:hypothetical protein